MAIFRFALLGIAFLIGGCAHSIDISPDITAVGQTQQVKSPKTIGYYFSEPVEKEVITSGGGGDQVKYKPYKDLATGIYKMYSNLFSGVTQLSSLGEATNSKVDYIAAVDISTSSSSPSLFTWPPTLFTLNLTTNITDAKGNALGNFRASGEGQAEFSEFVREKGLSGKRASQDALNKMQGLVVAAPFFAADKSTSPAYGGNASKEERLKDLKRLFDNGLITEPVMIERQRLILSQ